RRHTRWPRDWSSDVCSSDLGRRSGVLIEDLGVTPDAIHKMTRSDVLNGNVDLIEHAASLLAETPSGSVLAKIKRRLKTHFDLEEIGRASCRERVKMQVVTGA